MTLFTVEELREVVNARVLAGEGIGWTKHRIRRISLDTRSLRPGDLFLALRGDRFDGHDFIATALSRGAVGVIVLDSYDVTELALK
ncbi:MAG TPA: Mur ligase domain-containing protein, partial [Nitrospiraceae bacterium]|nr:Mur ligase domain-containing protein [Nitrospiraceae bacterium]